MSGRRGVALVETHRDGETVAHDTSKDRECMPEDTSGEAGPPGATRASSTDRGQTLPDFVIAIAVFLLAIAFVVAFIPQLTAPYDDQQQPTVTERIAADLTGQILTPTDSSGSPSEVCTIAFFEGTEEPGCRIDGTATLNDQLGVSERYSVNVTLRDRASDGPDSTVRCHDGDSIGPCGTDRLERGPPVPAGEKSIDIARHAVAIDGTVTILEVRVWQ